MLRSVQQVKPPQHAALNRAHPLARGLLAAWLTNEGGGLTLLDKSGNGHDATIASSGGWTMGPWGPTHDYTSIANADAGDISGTLFSADFTVAVRFMTPTVSTDFLWGKETAASSGMAMFLRATNDRVELRGSSLAMTTADGLINGGQWHTVVASRAGTSLILVVDGNVEASQTYTLDNKRAASFKLGATSYTALLPFDGIIDVAMVWENRGLSASEAREWCEDPTAMFWPAPRIYFIPAAAGGPTTHTITPSGGVAFAGSGVYQYARTHDVSGGVQLAGSAALKATRIHDVSGGVQFAGTSTFNVSRDIVPDGGVQIGGSATQTNVRVHDVSGGLSFSGAAGMQATRVLSPSGGLSLGGTGNFTGVEAGLTIVPSGGIQFGGGASGTLWPDNLAYGGFAHRVARKVADDVTDDVTDFHRRYDD